MSDYEPIIIPEDPEEKKLNDYRTVYEFLKKPPQTSAELFQFLTALTGEFIPWEKTCPDHATPWDYIWHSYRMDSEKWRQSSKPNIAYIGPRGGYKTLSVAKLICAELLLKPNCVSVGLGAIENHATTTYRYVQRYLNHPVIAEMGLVKRLLMKETQLANGSKYAQTCCTLSGVNALHCQKLRTEENDLMQPEILEEARLMVNSFNNISAHTSYVSSRKFDEGIMDNLVDTSEATNTEVLISCYKDTAEPCPVERRGINEKIYEVEDLFNPGESLVVQAYEFCGECPLLPSCFAPGTRILMADGSEKSIEEVKEGDLVWTHLGRPRRVRSTMHRHYDGEITELSAWGGNRSWRVTPEHPFNTPYGWKIAGALSAGHKMMGHNSGCIEAADYLLFPAAAKRQICATIRPLDFLPNDRWWLVRNGRIKTGERRRKFVGLTLPLEMSLTRDFGRFCGLYLSEGSLSKGTRRLVASPKIIHGVNWSLHRKETNISDFLQTFAKTKLDATSFITTQKDGLGICVGITGNVLGELLNALFGTLCDRKRIHPWLIEHAPEDFLHGMLDGVIEGDGRKRDGATTLANSVLPTQFALIGSMLDRYVAVHDRKTKPWKRLIREFAPIRFSTMTQHALEHHADGLHRRVKSTRRVPYSGPVFNLSVEEDESYIAELAAVHNCRGDLSRAKGIVKIDDLIKDWHSLDKETWIFQKECRKAKKSGIFFDDFDERLNVGDYPYRPELGWADLSIDFSGGGDDPTVIGFWQTDDKDNDYLVKEMVFSRKLASSVAREVMEVVASQNMTIRLQFGDSAAMQWIQELNAQDSFFKIRPVRKIQRRDGWSICKLRLRDMNGLRRTFFNQSCRLMIQEIKNAKKSKADPLDIRPGQSDHSLDQWRYRNVEIRYRGIKQPNIRLVTIEGDRKPILPFSDEEKDQSKQETESTYDHLDRYLLGGD